MVRTRVRAWLDSHRDQLVNDIRTLVQTESVCCVGDSAEPYGSGCASVLRQFLQLAESYGFETQNHENHCGSVLLRGNTETEIGLWGHLDVVAPGDGWSYPPFSASQSGDFLLGRGVQDNKGPVIATLYTLRCLRDLNIPLRHTFRQVAGCAEEAGMEDVRYYLSRNASPAFSVVTDCGFPVCHGEKGLLEITLISPPLNGTLQSICGGIASNIVPDQATLTLQDGTRRTAAGRSGHVAFPEGSVNAIAVLLHESLDKDSFTEPEIRALSFLAAVCSETDGSTLGVACADTCSGALTAVGSVICREADGSLSLKVNIRYPVTMTEAVLMRNLDRTAADHFFRIRRDHGSSPNYVAPDHPGVQALTAAYNRVTQQKTAPFVMGGGTYARMLPNAIAFGPGLPVDLSPLLLAPGHGGCHAPDEAVSIPNLLTAIEIYVEAFQDLDRTL